MEIKNELAHLSEREQKATGLSSPILMGLLQPAALLTVLDDRAMRLDCRLQHPALTDPAPILTEIERLGEDRQIIGGMIMQLFEYQYGLNLRD